MSEVRLVLLGDSWSEKSSVGNLILGMTGFISREEPNSSTRFQKPIKEKKLVVINTPNLLDPMISEEKLKGQVDSCLRLCASVPHLFLLVVQPENFTEEQKKRFFKILELFGNQSFDRALVLISTSKQNFPSLNQAFQDLIRKCRDNSFILKDCEREDLLEKISNILQKRKEEQSDSQQSGKTQQRAASSFSGATPGPGRS